MVGFWLDKGTCDETAANYIKSLHGKKLALFGTLGMGDSSEYFQVVKERVSNVVPKDNELLGIFLCQGKMLPRVRKRYETLLSQAPGDAELLRMIENFDRAVTHPDTTDLSNTADFVESICHRVKQNAEKEMQKG